MGWMDPTGRGTTTARPGTASYKSPFDQKSYFYTPEEWDAEQATFRKRQQQLTNEKNIAEAEAAITPEQRELARQKKYFDKFVLERDQQIQALEDEKKRQREREVQVAINTALARRNRFSNFAAGPYSGGGGVLSSFGGFGAISRPSGGSLFGY